MITADTITDDQIEALRVSDDPALTTQDRIMCSLALEDFRVMPRGIRMKARARCAEILNARDCDGMVRR